VENPELSRRTNEAGIAQPVAAPFVRRHGAELTDGDPRPAIDRDSPGGRNGGIAANPKRTGIDDQPARGRPKRVGAGEDGHAAPILRNRAARPADCVGDRHRIGAVE